MQSITIPLTLDTEKFADMLKTAGVVLPVYCRDCVAWESIVTTPPQEAHRCKWAGWLCGEDDFCSYGREKEDAENDG